MGDKLAVKVTIKGKDDLSAKLKALEARLQVFRNRAKLRAGKAELFAGSAMGKSLGAVKAVAGGAARMLGSIAKGFGLLGAASIGATAGIYRLVTAQAEAIDDASDMAARLGLTTQGLLELRYAAKASGIESKEFDTSLRRLNKGLGEFRATGKGALAGFIKTLPAEFQKNIKATGNNEEAIGLLFNAMDKIPDAAGKAAFASKFFGKSGDKIGLMAVGGADALIKLRAEFRRYYGEVTPETVAASKEMGTAQDRLKLSMDGLKQTIAAKLLPTLTPLVQRMAEFFADADRREAIGKKFKEVFGKIATALAGLNWSAIGNGIAKAVEIGTGLLIGFVQVMQGILNGDWTAVVDGFGQAWNAIKGPIGAVWGWIKKGFTDLLNWMAEHIVEWATELPAKIAEGTKNAIARSFTGFIVSAQNAKFESKRRPVLTDDGAEDPAASAEWGRWLGLDGSPRPAPTAVPGAASKIELTVKAAEGTTVTNVKATGPAAKGFKIAPVGANTVLGGAR